jgi:hypothetical protein
MKTKKILIKMIFLLVFSGIALIIYFCKVSIEKYLYDSLEIDDFENLCISKRFAFFKFLNYILLMVHN